MDENQKYKYQAEIDHAIQEGCIMPTLHSPEGMQAYRYCFSYPNANDYLPVLKINPKRKLAPEIRITGYALSCFANSRKAIAMYKSMAKVFKAIGTTIGDSLSGGNINNEDGSVDDVNAATTHFNLFEYETCDLSQTFEIIETL